MKSLVVEHDLKSQCLLAKVLAERGHEVTTFENAEQAILAYQKEFYPLLFVDVDLPGMDGLQYCRWIRSQPRGEGTYVIAAIEPTMPAEVRQVLEAGANDFLTKPYQLDQLRARLAIGERQMAQFFEQQKLERSLRSETERWTLVEAELVRTKLEFEATLKAKETELEQLREKLGSREAEREAEASLEISRQDKDLERLREEIGGLWERNEQSERALEESKQEIEAGLVRVREAEQALASANQELERLQAADAECTASLRETLRGREEELARLKQEVAEVREELTNRLREHTEELIKLSDQMRLSLEERMNVETELAAARDELTRRGRGQAEEALRLSDEFRGLVSERQRLELELESRNQAGGTEQKRLAAERDESRERLRMETEESDRLRRALATAKDREALIERDQQAALEELKVHRDARKRIESRWRVMVRLGYELNQAVTADGVARVAGRVAQELVGWDLFSLDAFVAEGGWIQPILSLESIEGSCQVAGSLHPGPQPTALMRRVLEDGPQLILCPAASCSGSEVVVVDHRRGRSASLLYVPLTMGHRTVGFLSVRSGMENAYNLEDIETLQMVAAQCASALERIETRSERGEESHLARTEVPAMVARANG